MIKANPYTNYLFQRDLERGRIGEYLAWELLKKKYPTCVMMEGYNRNGDIWIPETKEYLAEVKFDFMSFRTGNWAFEFECDNGRGYELSGVASSKARYWVQLGWGGIGTPLDLCVLFLGPLTNLRTYLRKSLEGGFGKIVEGAGAFHNAKVIIINGKRFLSEAEPLYIENIERKRIVEVWKKLR